MKKLYFAAIAFLLTATVTIAQDSGPVMSFETTTVDYGEIDYNADPLRVLAFTNTGDEPLVIKHAKGSCGCTVPAWPKEPIMPGETSQIEVRYDTKRPGPIRKRVTITTNEEGAEPHVLQVVGTVGKKMEEESVPTNRSNFLTPNNNNNGDN